MGRMYGLIPTVVTPNVMNPFYGMGECAHPCSIVCYRTVSEIGQSRFNGSGVGEVRG
jgi:hypothetical protein